MFTTRIFILFLAVLFLITGFTNSEEYAPPTLILHPLLKTLSSGGGVYSINSFPDASSGYTILDCLKMEPFNNSSTGFYWGGFVCSNTASDLLNGTFVSTRSPFTCRKVGQEFNYNSISEVMAINGIYTFTVIDVKNGIVVQERRYNCLNDKQPHLISISNYQQDTGFPYEYIQVNAHLREKYTDQFVRDLPDYSNETRTKELGGIKPDDIAVIINFVPSKGFPLTISTYNHADRVKTETYSTLFSKIRFERRIKDNLSLYGSLVPNYSHCFSAAVDFKIEYESDILKPTTIQFVFVGTDCSGFNEKATTIDQADKYLHKYFEWTYKEFCTELLSTRKPTTARIR